MKKNILKTVTSIIIAAVVCAGLALGAVSVSTSPDAPIVASHPSFIGGIW